MNTEGEIKALAEEIDVLNGLRGCLNNLIEQGYNDAGLYERSGNVLKKLEAHKAALSSLPVNTIVYLPVDIEDFKTIIEKGGGINLVGGRQIDGQPRWLKKTTIGEIINQPKGNQS
jgi:hypothetical protein